MTIDRNHTFSKTDIVKLIIFTVLTIVGIAYNNLILFVAMLYIIYCMLAGNLEMNFYYGLFLISNIRIFDSLGVTFCVNILLAIPLIKYLITYKFRVSAFALCSTLLMFIIEFVHIFALDNFDNLVSAISCFISMLYCLLVTTNTDIDIKPGTMWKYLVAGIFTSSLVYLVTNPSFTANIINNVIKGYRFSAFASDPNYFSLYICIALALVFTKSRYILSDYIVLIILMVLGLLTASKMCMLVMVATIMIGFIRALLRVGNTSQRRFLIAGLGVLLICIMAFNNELFLLVNNFLQRAGLLGNSFNMSEFTTGRFDILKEYVDILSTNNVALFLGYGMQYHLYLHGAGGYGAHNTYLDIVLSWGIIGTIILFVIFLIWKNKVVNATSGVIRYLPLIILVIIFCSLSCLSATMFWWVISFCLMAASKNFEGDLYVNK